LITAIIHLVVFIALDDKQADGPHSISQSYVATLSHLLGLIFRSCLCGALIIAFTQSMWRLMRIQTVKISSIELLFNIIQNPFVLAYPAVVQTAPMLFILVLFTWLLPIAITFPPGALIVVSKPVWSVYNTTVPTYNASFLGNSSLADAELHSLALTRVMQSAMTI
jgi:hypothetical protein